MKISFSNKFNFIATLLLSILLVATQMSAQGFIKTYPVITSGGSYLPKLEPKPGGWCLTTIPYHTGPHPYTELAMVETDLEGDAWVLTTGEYDQAATPHITPTGCGEYFAKSNFGPNDSLLIMKRFDIAGNEIWGDTVAVPGVVFSSAYFLTTSDGGLMFVGGNADGSFIQKQNADGQTAWIVQPGVPIPDAEYAWPALLFVTPDGGALFELASYFPSGVVESLHKISADGIIEDITLPLTERITGFKPAENGTYYLAQLADNQPSPPNNFPFRKFSVNHELLWEVDLYDKVHHTFYPYPFKPTNDNGILVAGGVYLDGSISVQTPAIARFDAAGNLLWKKFYRGTPMFRLGDGLELPDGSFVFAGIQPPSLMLLKMDANGVIYPNTLHGTIRHDENLNCLNDSTEMPFSGWIVKASAGGNDYYATTDTAGQFTILDLPSGPAYTIDVSVDPPAFLLDPCPIPQLTMPADTTGLTLEVEIPVQGTVLCPWMSVYLSTGEMRQCSESRFKVEYLNSGGGVAENAAIEVYLPAEITITSSTKPYLQNGQTLRFELGNLPPLATGQFYFTGLVSCDSAEIGQSLCVEAHVFPDSICLEPGIWSTASIEASGICEGDTIHFSLQNTGGAPTTKALDFVIIDDDVVMMEGQIPAGFSPGDVKNLWLPASGSTLRISAEQEPNHPIEGNPSVAIEGCNGFQVGFVNAFSNLTGNPFSDLLCRDVGGSLAENKMIVYPIGVGNQHLIERGTELEYIIQFQNVGNTAVNYVAIRDTLSTWLDPSTVHFGVASHPFAAFVAGDGSVVFKLFSAHIPGSEVNPDSSFGFVSFSAKVRANVPLGKILVNRAGINFNQNPVIMTNEVFHTIDSAFLQVKLISASNEALWTGDELQIFPNPAADAVSIIFKKGASNPRTLVLTDALGRTVLQKTGYNGSIELRRGELSAGLYFANILEQGQVMAVGKLVWR